MTVASVATTQRFNGNGSQTSFNYAYPYYANTDFKVYIGNTLQTLTTHYSVNPTGSLSEGKYPGANIVFVTAPVAGSLNVKISRRVTAVQNTDISNVTQLNTTDVETTLDKVVIIAQDSVDNANQTVDSAISAAVTAAEAAIAADLATATTAATTATTQAGIATTQASSASSSASTATTQASNASTSATLAGNYASYSEDNLVPGGSGYSALHWRNKAEDQYLLTQQIVDSLDDLTAGAYLAWESRTSNFTAIYGGRYLVEVSGLTANTTLTITPPSSPTILTEYEILCTNCTDVRSITFSNSPDTIEGYETEQLKMAEPFFLKMKWNTVTSKWYPVLRKLARLLPRAVSSNITYNGGNPVLPNEILHVNTVSGSRTIDLPFGNVLPRIGDEVTIVDYFNNFDTNPCTLNTNGKLTNSTNTNIFINEKGFRNTFVYKSIAEGWMIK